MQGARRGTRSWDSRITPWAEGGPKPLSPPGCPHLVFNSSARQDIGNKAQLRTPPSRAVGSASSVAGSPPRTPGPVSSLPCCGPRGRDGASPQRQKLVRREGSVFISSLNDSFLSIFIPELIIFIHMVVLPTAELTRFPTARRRP